MEAEEELQVEVDCGKTDKLTVELKLGHAEIFVSGLRYKIAIAFTLFIFCLVRYKCSAAGEAAWVADQHRRLAASSSSAGPSGTQHNAMKRARDSGDTAADVDMETAEPGQEEVNGSSSEVVKKQRSVDDVKVDLTPAAVTKSPVTSAGPGANLNLPLPSASGRACIVKLYGGGHGELKLHDLVEFVGVISLDPAMAATEPDTEDCMSSSPALPPPSLVPRLHVLSWTRLHHNNPLVPRPPAAVPPVQV